MVWNNDSMFTIIMIPPTKQILLCPFDKIKITGIADLTPEAGVANLRCVCKNSVIAVFVDGKKNLKAWKCN